MRPLAVSGGKKGRNGVFLPGRVPHHFAALANALIRLDMRAGRHLLQEHLDWLGALLALESKDTGWLDWHGGTD